MMLPQTTRAPLTIQLVNLCQATVPEHSLEALIQALALLTIKGNFDPADVIEDFRDATKSLIDVSENHEDCDCGGCSSHRSEAN